MAKLIFSRGFTNTKGFVVTLTENILVVNTNGFVVNITKHILSVGDEMTELFVR